MTKKKLTPVKIALRNIIDAVESDIANGAQYMTTDPDTREPLPERTAQSVERHMNKILDGLKRRLRGGL